MTIDEVVQVLNASLPEPLTELQEWLLRSTWEGQTYEEMAQMANYTQQYLRKSASELWSKLSDFWGKPINKPNFRNTLEPRHLTKIEKKLIENFNELGLGLPLDFPSGPVPLDSRFYISRPPIEELAYGEVMKPGCMIRIKAPRQMGKSSLMLRISDRAAAVGYKVVLVDFQQADVATFTNLDKLLRWISANVTQQLRLEFNLDDYWMAEIGSKVSCTNYFQGYLLPTLSAPLLLIFNEFNLVFEYPEIAQDFLPMLRFWHEQAKQTEIWKNLRLVVAYSTEVYIPLKLNQSPFNVGLPLKLLPFSMGQVQELARRHGLDWTDGKEAKRLMAMVGGHPHLIRLALYHLCQQKISLKELLQETLHEGGIYGDHLRRLLGVLQSDQRLYGAFKKILSAHPEGAVEAIATYQLDSLGLIQIQESPPKISCELYRAYFQAKLLDKTE